MIYIKKNSGFTLIELMIVVVIVGLLAAIAYPSYTSSVRNAQYSDARDSLMTILGLQERRRTNSGNYTTDLSLLGLTETAGVFLSDEGYFAITATQCTSNTNINDCVQLSAAPTSKAASGVQTLTTSSIGEKIPSELW